MSRLLVACTLSQLPLAGLAPCALSDEGGADLRSGDRFALLVENEAPRALKIDDLRPGQAIFGALPLDPATGALRSSSRLNAVNLIRVAGTPPAHLADTNGIAVYSSVCTHKGCSITSWQPEVSRFRCFCHMSEFDALAKGEAVEGPAVEPLPRVPAAIDAEGYITATAGFSAVPGAAG